MSVAFSFCFPPLIPPPACSCAPHLHPAAARSSVKADFMVAPRPRRGGAACAAGRKLASTVTRRCAAPPSGGLLLGVDNVSADVNGGYGWPSFSGVVRAGVSAPEERTPLWASWSVPIRGDGHLFLSSPRLKIVAPSSVRGCSRPSPSTLLPGLMCTPTSNQMKGRARDFQERHSQCLARTALQTGFTAPRPSLPEHGPQSVGKRSPSCSRSADLNSF